MRIDSGGTDNRTFQLIYVSTATVDCTVGDLRELATVSQSNNQMLDITGVLIYHRGTFLQVLEGDVTSVMRLLDRLRGDWRHKNIDVVKEETIERRHFADWPMQPTSPDDVLNPSGTVYRKLFESDTGSNLSFATEADTLFVMSAFCRDGRRAFT